ncbi:MULTISPECIES: hypothetical protein [Rhodomicrobium]|uniref:hypothetical protein n=1 Tax=Rhodomicrobium TaxID=1068 RepID=UPI000B4C181D|nr:MULTISPECIES: hypothetical protein [Rhodomicrobium]
MKLSTPSFGIFAISSLLVILIILAKYFAVEVPILTPVVEGHPFEITLIAWALLFAGVTFNL